MFILIFSSLILIALWLPIKTYAFITRRPKVPAIWITLLLVAVYITSLYFGRHYYYDAYRWLTDIMGVINYGFFMALAYWLVYAILRIRKQQHCLRTPAAAKVLLGLTLGLCAFASYNYYKTPSIEQYTLTSDKVTRAYRFVHISDIQFGTSTRARMEHILRKAYALKPEFIVFTGDLVDFDFYELEDFSLLAQSPVPVYFERGNHEFYHLPQKLLDYLQRLDAVKLLIDDSIKHDELHIIGLDYHRSHSNVAKKLPALLSKNNAFSILLYHEPVEVQTAASFGIDLLLYGHTHAGQMWPFTHVVDAIYQYSDGPYQIGDSFAYVSDGASLWGPRMRLGSQNEMTLFTVEPTKAEK